MWSHSPAWKQKQKKKASFFKTEKRNRLFIDPRWYRFLASLALWNAVTSANYWDNSLFFSCASLYFPALAYEKRQRHWFALQHCHQKPSLTSQSDSSRVRFPRQSKQSFVPQLAHQIAQQQQPGSPHPCPRMATCSPGPPAPGS